VANVRIASALVTPELEATAILELSGENAE
jgi:hypothetical protein